jgi:hypothetical protein
LEALTAVEAKARRSGDTRPGARFRDRDAAANRIEVTGEAIARVKGTIQGIGKYVYSRNWPDGAPCDERKAEAPVSRGILSRLGKKQG